MLFSWYLRNFSVLSCFKCMAIDITPNMKPIIHWNDATKHDIGHKNPFFRFSEKKQKFTQQLRRNTKELRKDICFFYVHKKTDFLLKKRIARNTARFHHIGWWVLIELFFTHKVLILDTNGRLSIDDSKSKGSILVLNNKQIWARDFCVSIAVTNDIRPRNDGMIVQKGVTKLAIQWKALVSKKMVIISALAVNT